MTNLLGNAIKFTAMGSITISIKRYEEDVRHDVHSVLQILPKMSKWKTLYFAIQVAGMIIVTVEDTGTGIPKEELPTIFDKTTDEGSTRTFLSALTTSYVLCEPNNNNNRVRQASLWDFRCVARLLQLMEVTDSPIDWMK